MPQPAISIVMPVYNAAPFLAEAMESLLKQSYPDFELIIIDDGSLDASVDIIRGFSDERIRLLSNDVNRGVIHSLNRGVSEALGSYIARMDADDIAMPDRLRMQKEYLDDHPDIDVVAGIVALIDAEGRDAGRWPDDARHVSPGSIRAFMPVNNCIAHPTVMVRADVLRAFGYRTAQKGAEDYDLWLRMLAAGRRIGKVDAVVLKHRLSPQSVTRQRQQNIFFNLATTKGRFIMDAFRRRKISKFVYLTCLSMLADLTRGAGKYLKQQFSVT
jgi:glycosyltransferase involved in cell wall biosynthesis